MDEFEYEIMIDGFVAARCSDLEIAYLVVEGLFNKYYKFQKTSIIISQVAVEEDSK